MENENQEQLNNVPELSPKPKRSRRSRKAKAAEPVLPVSIDEPIVEDVIKEQETIVFDVAAPAAPTPPAPAAAPNPKPAVAIEPKKGGWKPLVRPRRQTPPPSAPGRRQRKAR